MHRFYFDIRDSRGDHRDDHGDIFATDADAEQQALTLLLDVAPDDLGRKEGHLITCRVRDERGLVIYEAHMITQGKRFPNGVEPAVLDALDMSPDGANTCPGDD